MAVVASATGAAVFGLSGVAAGVAGGALLGAGAGALYSGITGDGNILNSALTGGLLGAGVGGLGAAVGPALMGETAGVVAGGTQTAAGASPALQAAQGLTSLNEAGLNQAALSQGVFAEGSAALPGANLAAAPNVIEPAISGLKNVVPMTGKEMLGYGLAGTAAMSLLGGMNKPKLSANTGTSPSTIRPYTYSQTKNPNYGVPGETYYNQSYTAQPTYKAADGGVIRMAQGGLPAIQNNMYPQSQQETVNFATPSQTPISAEVLDADFDSPVNAYTGEVKRMADGGVSEDPNMRPPVPAPQVNPAMQVGLVPPPVVGNKYTMPQQAPAQAITDYNALLAGRANNEYNVQPAPLNMLPGGGQNASAGDLNKIINQYYVNNLNRQGEQSGLDYFTQQVQTGTPLSQIKKEIAGSQEGQIAGLYRSVLKRAPDASGLDYYQQQLKSGVPIADIQKSLQSSAEGVSKMPTPAVSGPSQADIDAYLAANPTTVKTYDPKTQTYSAPSVTQAMIDAWKTSQAPSIPTGMYTAPDGSMYVSKEAYDAKYRGANGGLMPNALKYAQGGKPDGGSAYNLGSYSDGGRLLKGPGDGVSDDIPAVIGQNQPARLADGEFVIPARIVSEIGNGSTDAGAKRLYAMMDKIQAGRKKTIGKKNVAKDTKAKKHLLA